MKVIFLDIDGVLNTLDTTDSCGIYCGVDDDKILLLKRIVNSTNAKLVLSSSWRVNKTRDGEPEIELRNHLDKRLAQHGLEIYSETPEHPSGNSLHRGWEIKQWRDQHKNLDYWIVLDDMIFNDFHKFGVMEHLVLTDEWDGLTERDTEKAIWMLENCKPYGFKVADDI